MRLALGSENKAKRRALEMAAARLFPGADIVCVKVPSGVKDQPTSDEEAMLGAENRARAAREATDADYGVGLEAGYQQIGSRFFTSGWAVVVDRQGRFGFGSTARFELSAAFMARMTDGKEMADVVDEITGRSAVNHEEGMFGMITKGELPRDLA
jgi:inosine/xanthosine triphosphatase